MSTASPLRARAVRATARQTSRWSLVAVVFCLSILVATAAEAKSYSAERFDSVVRVLPGGMLDVTETVVFRFEDGTFREVFREIPLRRTDGIDVVRAEIQGRRLPFGNETGTVEVRRRSNRIRVIWRFGSVEGVTREFVLNYIVRGAVRQENADLLIWRATPGEHVYSIDASTIRFELPAVTSTRPLVTTRRVASSHVSVDGRTVHVESSNIGRNGWIDASLTFPRGAVAASPPLWQQHAAQVSAQSGTWFLIASLVAVAGVILLFAWRQSYDSPPGDVDGWRDDAQQPRPPDTLAPAIGGVLAANGRSGLEHAMAVLFSLADRGVVQIQEQPRGAFGQRSFVISRRGESQDVSTFEQGVLETVFGDRTAPSASVTLARARSRLTRRFRDFSKQMTRELAVLGLLDESRQAIRDRYTRAAIVFLIAGGLGVMPAALLSSDYGGWPILIPGALLAVGAVALVFAATITPLSNDGVRRAARWRAYGKHLIAVGQGKRDSAGLAMAAVLPAAVALGLADTWSKFLKRRGEAVPAWFHALPGDADSAFPAFIATGGAGMSSHGHGGATAGAAGGGASGAH